MIVWRLATGANMALLVPITICESPAATFKKFIYRVVLGREASSSEKSTSRWLNSLARR